MTPIEIIAFIFASLLIFKIIIACFYPRLWINFTRILLWRAYIPLMVVYLFLLVIVGHYIISALNNDVALFGAIIAFVGLLMVPYRKTLCQMRKEALDLRGDIIKKSGLAMLIWLILAVYIVYYIIAS